MSYLGLADRCLILGDSIDIGVYSDIGPGDPSKLWVNRLPDLVGISVSNLSVPGMSITSPGGSVFGLVANLNAITMAVGYAGAKWAIITAGTNDTSNWGTGIVDYIESYRKVIAHCRSLGLIVVVVSPKWRGDVAAVKAHIDGNYSLEVFRVYGEMMAYEEKTKPGPAVHVITGMDAPLLPEHYVVDKLHLNEAGQTILTYWLVGRLVSLGLWSLRVGVTLS
ncbi:hypothetical protein BK660_21955 [Pseudomonas brassicacearum]|uniref:SGNH hydrolase-type esterase domain-containing protein n=1 Tax=Pseudomonas brassicacearum TaxID=930166 RepID=A0A423HXK9_9PSED|nr:SGNH/GDSL hydrolase family protein [Pseudomonas brassicacearum]RON17955.1 hypothetical protein BK660_21955 [Pseudomonas brassicacearum]